LAAAGLEELAISVRAPSSLSQILNALGVDQTLVETFTKLFQMAKDNWTGLEEWL